MRKCGHSVILCQFAKAELMELHKIVFIMKYGWILRYEVRTPQKSECWKGPCPSYDNSWNWKRSTREFIIFGYVPGNKYLFIQGTEGGNRTGSILTAGLHLGPDLGGLWARCPVSMETTYRLENQALWMEEPQGSYLDSLLPKRIL